MIKLFHNKELKEDFYKKHAKEIESKISKINCGSIVALTHLIYKEKLAVNKDLIEKLEKAFIAKEAEATPSKFAVFTISIGNLIGKDSKIFKDFAFKYFGEKKNSF